MLCCGCSYSGNCCTVKFTACPFFKQETLVCVHHFGNFPFPFSWNGRTDTVILNLRGSVWVLFCKWHSVPTQWSSVECVRASLSSSPSQACQSCFLWSLIGWIRCWSPCLVGNVAGKRYAIYCVSGVCLLTDSVEEERMIPLYTFVIPLPLWGMPPLMKASSLSTFLISALLTSPVSWSARPRRILLHSSAWVKIFSSSSFPPSPHPQITSVLVYRQSTVVPPASYPPPLLMVELRKAVPAQQIVLLFLFLYSFFLSPTYLLSFWGLLLTLILTWLYMLPGFSDFQFHNIVRLINLTTFGNLSLKFKILFWSYQCFFPVLWIMCWRINNV